MLVWIDWPRQQRKNGNTSQGKAEEVGKEIERQVLEGEIVEPEERTAGLPEQLTGVGESNEGKSIREWRAGRGAV